MNRNAKEMADKYAELMVDKKASVLAAELDRVQKGRKIELQLKTGEIAVLVANLNQELELDKTLPAPVAAAAPVKEEGPSLLERAEELLDFLEYKYELKLCGDRAFKMHPLTGVLQEFTKGVEDIKHVSRDYLSKIGIKQLKDIDAAHSLSMSLARTRHAHRFVIDTAKVPAVLFSGLPKAPCWNRLDMPASTLDTCPPAFAELTGRIKTQAARDGLYQWLGSVMDLESDRSLYAYIYAPGGDGKSTIIDMLKGVFQNAYYVTRGDSYSKQFGKAAIEGKRLVVFQEESGVGFISSAAFKELTGDSTIEVEQKFLPAYNIEPKCKVLCISNYPPELRGGKADERRLMIVELNPRDKGASVVDQGFYKRLKAEGPQIMQFCWTQYQKWKAANPDGGLMGDREAVKLVAEGSQVNTARATVEAFFDLEGQGVSADQVRERLKSLSKGDPYFQRELTRQFKDLFGIAKNFRSGDKRIYGYSNLRVVG